MAEVTTFPPPVDDPGAWTAEDLAGDESWIQTLPKDTRSEIYAALEDAARRQVTWDALAPGDLQLPHLDASMARAANDVERGFGMALLRGLDTSALSEAQLRILLTYASLHLGTPRPQSAAGELMTVMADQGAEYASDPEARGYQSSDEMQPHTDGCDVLAVLCVRQAQEGGSNYFASSLAIYNELRRAHPELLDGLFRGFHYNLRDGAQRGDRADVTEVPIPVFFERDGVLSCFFNRKSIEGAVAKLAQPLSERDKEALLMIDRLAQEDRFRFDLRLEAGDLLFVNNLTTLHSRRGFRDGADPDRKRAILRMWLTSHRPRPLPEPYHSALRQGFGKR